MALVNAHLAMVQARVDEGLHHLVTSEVTPGVSYAIIDHGSVLERHFGDLQRLPERKPLPGNYYYDLASLTKVIGTTPLLLRALLDGLLQLDEPLVAVLPDFSVPTVTIRQLATHTSGLEGYIPHRDELSAPELRQAFMTQLHAGPDAGRKVVYRDFNLLLLGWALEKVYGGEAIQDLISDRVLPAFGIEHTASFVPPVEMCVPTTYSVTAGLRQGLVHDPKAAILGAHSGAAGLFAQLDGVVGFVQAACNLRPQSLLPADWAADLQRDFSGGLGRSIGFDLRRGPISGRLWLYHTGYTGTFFLIDPQSQSGLVVLANRVHPDVHPDFLRQRDIIVQRYLAATESA
nr:serine hydrolase domain-containing protein [Lacticaseibacillus zhaodongensis]